MAKTDNNLSPKASSLYNRLFDSLLAQADSANWDYKNPSVQVLSAIVLNDNNLTTGPNSYIDGGTTPEEIEARSAVYLSTIQKASQAVDTLIHTDIGQYNQYKELSSSVLEAVSAEDESQIQNLLPEIIVQPETVTPVEISKDTVLIETSPLTSSSIDSVSLAYFNRYQQVLNGIVQDGSIDFEPQTIEDMKAYGIDEPSIINPMTFAGQDFYGFMTSPESVDLVRQGIIENIDVADQARQLEILDLLKIDADRMVREYPREMDGPIADAQGLHLAFASTVNPNGREEVLDAIGSNHETADRLADGIIMSMPEIKLTENFTSAVEIDPTIPKPDVASVISNAPLLSSIEGSDSLPNTDVTTPPAPQEDVLTVAADVVETTVTNISDASILLDGKASNDMYYLKDLVEEAKLAGVDSDLITNIEAQLESKDFVTTQAATQGVQSYADALKAALENDGVLTQGEYNGALSNLFGAISSGMVVDRAGMADDIAAAPGMEIQAKDSIRHIFDIKAEGLVTSPEQLVTRPQPRPSVPELAA